MRFLRASLLLSLFVSGCQCGSDFNAFDAAPGADGAGCFQSCKQAGANCGRVGNLCGGFLECGTCTPPETCGGGGFAGICGQRCKARTCASQGISCGPAGDGCGGLLDCGSCTAPQTCGGGGKLSTCGGNSGCVARTCAQQSLQCGPAGDGCGGVIQCGSCTPPDSCGGGGTTGMCGKTGTGVCVPKTCAQLSTTCGPASNGCGGLLQCGTCTTPQTCGGGGTAGSCGGNSGCVPKTCAQQNIQCGPAGDGCGGLLQCGKCTSPQTCGGAGTPAVCGGSNACVPKTCAQLGFNCGPAGDGCGGLIQCGTCKLPDICGGGGAPGVCGGGKLDGGTPCTNLCLQKVACDGGVVTTISGTVYNPAGTDPVYNALVYIPNATVQPFTPGVSCDKCGTAVSGSPLMSATTGPDGKFVLKDVPVRADVPIVIQVGRWRRQISVSVTACTDNPIAAMLTHLPRNQSEGDIPQIAMVTGAVDAMECVLRKMGIDDAEFGNPPGYPAGSTGSGRIHFYYANDAVESPVGSGDWYGMGAKYDASTPNSHILTGSSAQLAKYDMVIFACEGLPIDTKQSDQPNVIKYADSGGRVFATHYSYAWLSNGYIPKSGPAPFSGTANWQFWLPFVTSPLVTTVDQTFPKGQAFAQWLQIVSAQWAPGQVAIYDPRQDVKSVVAPSQRWLYSTTPQTVQHYTFNTPVGTAAAQQCGRVVFSDFHVTGNYTYGALWPTECTGSTLSPQEKVLEFMLFDLSNCIEPDKPPPPPTCTPKTCAQLGFKCGPAGDGCGGVLACGNCTPPDWCGGGGVPGVCGHTPCPPWSCASQAIQCGPAGDGCGNQLDCGPCVPPDTCGGGGTPGVCGHPSCTPTTCASQGLKCGPAGDGCGNPIDCGPCVPPDTCGGGGTPGVCGHNVTCPKLTCKGLGFDCGPAADGCGGLLQCGDCVPPDTCGGGGVPGKCGHVNCSPMNCKGQGLECGPAGDGCGNLLDCGPCIPPDTCGGGGVPGKCGSFKPPA